jgi:NAD(P)-dependent dehydrogenase (short-subunit alcohol dehydrogenase family)
MTSSPSSRRFEGKVALVTGGGNGIGEAICRRLACEGATVAVLDLDESADAVSSALGAPAVALRADVGDATQVATAFASLHERFGRVDVVANNAAISGDATPLHELSEETWDKVMAVNLRGAFLVLRAALRTMLAQGGGAVVNTASMASLRARPGAGAYASSKGGLLMMTRQAGAEYAAKGIRVNAVCPGAIHTRLMDRLTPEVQQGLVTQIPMGRVGTTDEVASAVAFLASDDASFITGEYLVIDGGRNAT